MSKRFRYVPQLFVTGLCAASLFGCGASRSVGEVSAAPPAAKPETPRDPVAGAIADLLRPSAPTPPLAVEQSAPVPPRLPRSLEHPEAPVPLHAGTPPRAVLPLPASGNRPRPLRPEMPLARERTDQRLPQTVELPEGTLLKLPGPDLENPIPVPLLSQGQPDRIPLTDPTRDASMEAALSAPITARETPAPFERLNLPEPFAYRDTARLRTPPPEPVGLSLLPPRTPPKSLPEKGTVRSASR
jgi:hypothetical protein